MKTLAADAIPTIFGQVSPVGIGTTNPVADLGNLISTGIKYALLFGAMLTLVFLLWGALDWIVSGGDKEKLLKAQNKLINALVGLLIIVVALSVYGVVAGDMLGIITRDPATGGWSFVIPTL